MSPPREAQEEFDRLYGAALETYLRRRDEEALSVAYELGRRAMVEGFGIIDMATAHREALASTPPLSSDLRVTGLEAAEDFFRELLSPFEMVFRGYLEANAELRSVNGALLREREAVLAANQELEAFSYSVSHDLRAPLRAMAGFSSALQDEQTGPLNPDQTDCVASIVAGAQKMGQLIDGLLDLSRVALADVARASVDLTALALDVVGTLRRAEPGRDVEVLVQDSLVVDADPRLMGVVLTNLLGNAWKFTSRRATAKIELGVRTVDARQVVYFVRDNGAGFDMAYAKKLFGAFQRLHPANEFEGTGIGLATVQRVIRRHGGRIWAEGHRDEGATFLFTLPDRHAA